MARRGFRLKKLKMPSLHVKLGRIHVPRIKGGRRRRGLPRIRV